MRSSGFYRGLSPGFLAALERLVEAPDGQWWRDVLARRDLVVAVRAEYLNVYHRGASLFRVERRGEALVPVTHAKYLSRRQQGLVALQPDGRFGLDPESALWLRYAGPATLSDMVKAAADLAGPEKIGLHALLLASPHVVDVEIAFGAEAAAPAGAAPDADAAPEEDDAAPADGANAAAEVEAEALTEASIPSASAANRRQDRLDVATLEERDGAVFVVFHEAKHFTNPELRASPDRSPPIVAQIARYRQTLARNAEAIGHSYRDVCTALARIAAMRDTVLGSVSGSSATAAPLDPLIARVAGEALVPQVDPEPRLVVFGFDRDQRDGALARHSERLTGEHGLTVYALGNPTAKASAAFRRPRLSGAG